MKAPTIEELADFTLKSYSNLLQYLRQTYKIVPFCAIPQKDVPYLILRHDIDVSLPAALKMAKLEYDMGVRSTYFVLFSGGFYNVLEGNNVKILRQISNLGHEIGLHYYPHQHRIYGQNMTKTLKIEIQLLEHLLVNKVYSIARHGPWDKDPFATIKGYINANHPNLRRDMYIHDSCRAWTPLDGLYRLLNDPPKRVQLLTHPENWQEDKIDRKTLLERFNQLLDTEVTKIKKETENDWLTDPLSFKYYRLMKKENYVQFQNRMKSTTVEESKFQELAYYGKLFRYYMVNTSLGWSLHPIIEKIRNIFKVRR